MEIKGKIHEVFPTAQVTESLKKREVIGGKGKICSFEIRTRQGSAATYSKNQ